MHLPHRQPLKFIGRDGFLDVICYKSLRGDSTMMLWCGLSSPLANVLSATRLLPSTVPCGPLQLISPSSCFSILQPSILHVYPAQWSYIKVSRASWQGLGCSPGFHCSSSFLAACVSQALGRRWIRFAGNPTESCGGPRLHCLHSVNLTCHWWPAPAWHRAAQEDILYFKSYTLKWLGKDNDDSTDFFFFLATLCGLQDLSFLTKDWIPSLAVKSQRLKHLTTREFL